MSDVNVASQQRRDEFLFPVSCQDDRAEDEQPQLRPLLRLIQSQRIHTDDRGGGGVISA